MTLPTFSLTLEVLTMLTLSTGSLLKVCLPSSLLQSSRKPFPFCRVPPDILSAVCHVLIDWNHRKLPFFSEPPVLHIPHIHIPSTNLGSGRQVAPSAETTGQAQIVKALGTPFVLEGLFGEADADAKPKLELAGDAMGMDVEDDMKGSVATAESGMIVENDGTTANIISTLGVFQPTQPCLETVKKVYYTVWTMSPT